MEFTQEKFNKLKNEVESYYFSIGHVHCPYFGEKVSFNTRGFEHLFSKSWDHGRNIADQFSRLRHVKTAPEIIFNSKTLQGIRMVNEFERVKTNNRWERVLTLVAYYEFIAITMSHGSKVRMKVVVKQVGNGGKFFFSIIPHWKINKQTKEKILHDGDLY